MFPDKLQTEKKLNYSLLLCIPSNLQLFTVNKHSMNLLLLQYIGIYCSIVTYIIK